MHTEDAGTGDVKVLAMGPGGITEKTTLNKVNTYYDCVYKPTKPGLYIITITFGGQQITGSPFRVNVGVSKTSKIYAFGPGLETGVVGLPACFTVETNKEIGTLGKLHKCILLVILG